MPLRPIVRSSTVQTIQRPVWRSFSDRRLATAARHARAGGHAVVWTDGATWLLLPCDANEVVPALSHWTILMLERHTYDVVRAAPATGLARLRVPRRFEHYVRSWCERDAGWPGAVRTIELDCATCGVCCHGCRAVLGPADVARFRAAGRADLQGSAYVRRSAGERVLRLREAGGACVHQEGTRCGIYALRPDACRAFPVGSEGCLDARLTSLGIVDAAPAVA